MTCRPWFPFYTADYDRDTKDLTIEQHGVYMLLLKATWDRPSCSLPDDMNFIRRVLPLMHGLTFKRLVPPVLNRFFEKNEKGEWHSKRLTKERRNAEETSEKQSRNAKKRWENKGDDHANAMPSQSQRKKEDTASAATKEVDLPSSKDRYAFEKGVIRLNKKHFDQWKEAYSHLDLVAELVSLAPWAGKLPPGRWFCAVPNALNNKNTKIRLQLEQIKNPPKFRTLSGMDGII